MRQARILPLLFCGALACDSDLPEANVDPGQQLQTGSACNVDNLSGLPFQLTNLEDPFAKLILKEGEGCPKSFTQIMDKLAKAEPDCVDNTETRIISEIRANTGLKTGNFRSVTTRECGDRKNWEITFSAINGGGPNIGGNVEVISFDRANGVFNYYDLVGGGIAFFGNSKQFIDNGHGQGQERKCAGCHTGGGLIMKELHSPWLHWDSPNHLELAGGRVDFFAQANPAKKRTMGTFAGGFNMQRLVENGNVEWTKHRIAHLKASGDVKRLLEPLFCETEVNLDNGVGNDTAKLNRIPRDALNEFAGSSVPVTSDDYQSLITELEHRVPASMGFARDQETGDIFLAVEDLTKDGEVVRDVAFDFTFIERSEGDREYTNQLSRGFELAGEQFPALVTPEFADAALSIDMTRQIYSTERCNLLRDFAPELSAEEITPEAITEGFKKNLEGAESPQAKAFLARLDANKRIGSSAAQAFMKECAGRDQKEFLRDVMTVTAINRAKTRDRFEVYREQAGTMPVDKIEIAVREKLFQGGDDTRRFDPNTCELVNGYAPLELE